MDEKLIPKDKHLLPHPVSTLDPVIKINDLTEFKNRSKNNVEKKVISKLEELKREYLELMESFDVNKQVLESEIRFEPKQGSVYYLYERSDATTFLSIISPKEWGKTDFVYLGDVRLNSENIWEKIDVT